MKKPSEHTQRTPWLVAVTASLALHAVVIDHKEITGFAEEIFPNIPKIVANIGTDIRRFLSQLSIFQEDAAEKNELIQRWKNKLFFDPNLESFDYGDFFLSISWIVGDISEEELELDKKHIAQMGDRHTTIRSIVNKEQGRHKEGSGTLHALIAHNEGNCEARAQKMISMVKKLSPGTPLKMQISRIQDIIGGKDRMHIRGLAKIDGVWRALEPNLPEITQEDIKGTQIFDPSDYVRIFLAQQDAVKQVEQKGEPNKNPLALTLSDEIIHIPFDAKHLETKSEQLLHFNLSQPAELEILTEAEFKERLKTPEQPEQQKPHPKRQLTEQEIVGAILSGTIEITPDIEDLGPIKKIKLKEVRLVADKDNFAADMPWPSLEPLRENPPEFLRITDYRKENPNPPDITPLNGTTEIHLDTVRTDDPEKWSAILRYSNTNSLSFNVFGHPNANLKFLRGTNPQGILHVYVEADEVDLTGIDQIDSLPAIKLSIKANRLINPQPLAKIPGTLFTFRCPAHLLPSLEGIIVRASYADISFHSQAEIETIKLRDHLQTSSLAIDDNVDTPKNPHDILKPITGMTLTSLTLSRKPHNTGGDTTSLPIPLDMTPLKGMQMDSISLRIDSDYKPIYP